MKSLTSSEIKSAKKMAYSFAFSINNLILNRRFKFDARTRIGKAANVIIKELIIDKKSIITKRKLRFANKLNVFSNILNNKLLLDFRAHTSDVRFIHANFIQFWNRNHHAKNEQDLKVLSVIKKYYGTV